MRVSGARRFQPETFFARNQSLKIGPRTLSAKPSRLQTGLGVTHVAKDQSPIDRYLC